MIAYEVLAQFVELCPRVTKVCALDEVAGNYQGTAVTVVEGVIGNSVSQAVGQFAQPTTGRALHPHCYLVRQPLDKTSTPGQLAITGKPCPHRLCHVLRLGIGNELSLGKRSRC